MPPFSFLKHSRKAREVREQEEDVAHDKKTEHRRSKRDFLRGLLKGSQRSSFSSQSGASRRSGQIVTPQSLPIPSLRSPPISPNLLKPLPLPPLYDSEPESTPKSPMKLDRIMTPISTADLQKLFSGAPQFFARSEGHHTGAPHPSVAFPWDVEVRIRDLCDHRQITDEAWSSASAWPHIIGRARKSPEEIKEHYEKQKAHFLPRCRERPNMLSMFGIERGSIGYQAALELGVADALETPDESLDEGPAAVMQHRKKFFNEKDGLRQISESTLIDRLMDVSEIYHNDPLKHQRPVVQLYTELFTHILFPPTKVTDTEDPYSVQIQIGELIHVLAAPFVWIDFSLVEWRIKLGQILWGPSGDVESDDDILLVKAAQESTDQKFFLLLQILLSCELLIRLDAISMNMDHGDMVKADEIRRFEKDATTSVKWSLILARVWLENIRLEKSLLAEDKPAGWLATLTGSTSKAPVIEGIGSFHIRGSLSFPGRHGWVGLPGSARKLTVTEGISSLQFRGRHEKRQLDGLLHFARKLGWPDLENLSAQSITISNQGTPLGTPMSASTQHTSYFSNQPRRPGVRRGLSLQKNVSALIEPQGWLSNSYLSGLILPGEGLSHFLISTLLENDSAAVSRLGEQANLYGGFIYSGKSFWSTACIVGRVLAAGRESRECMGWISSDTLTRGSNEEGWVDIDVEYTVVDDPDTLAEKARLWQKATIEHDGHVIGGADYLSVLPGDFVVPSETTTQPPITIKLGSLELFAEDSSSTRTPAGSTNETSLTEIAELRSIQTYSAMLRFTINDGDEREIHVALTHDAHFVTAHPCIVSENNLLKSPTMPASPASEQIHSTPQESTGHPLHKAFTYTTTSLTELLATSATTPFSTLLSSPTGSPPGTAGTNSSTHTTSSTIPRILVVDCTFLSDEKKAATGKNNVPGSHHFGSDMEILARAICAERGWNALINRRGRGCLACAVREAGALGWRVILRVA